ncbi:ribonuclease HII [Alkalicoccus urumqiensis]|uniref:Ribonuclease HII n=1 Tax=Alkalicoccus urumqiensis TaxID=1548213 RepID=A0A2P6MG39_ALKUR|nr:ribonuclease HII [Alkalicoccus urumqiensis]PRO65246.1 ribonuclease HII [Alkalicoccus urumqiensis]
MKQWSVAQVQQAVQEGTCSEEDIQEWEKDPRAGVRKACAAWRKREARAALQLEQWQEMCAVENSFARNGFQAVGGVDEVGRGPLAGPVTAACVILPDNFYLPGLTDSKQLSDARRREFAGILYENALVGIGSCSAQEIDELNIYQASRQAMVRAVQNLPEKPDALLVDAMNLPLDLPQESLIKGDARSVSIAAASVCAKVHRDDEMKQFDAEWPDYGFAAHAGYGTKQHLEALETHGVLSIHRKSFTPVKNCL